jgi:hypothetical protein
MANAPTPPPHVPCNFIKAGGAGLSQAQCKAALIACGYSPSDFGTYKDVKKKIQDANKKKIQDANKAKAAGATSSSGSGSRRAHPDKDPTRLAGYQAGHLSQNATQTSGRRNEDGRSDPCRNPPSCRATYVPPSRQGGNPYTQQPSGGFRGGNISQGCNGTPGYQAAQAPCMPQQGSAQDPNSGHGFVTHQECEAARQAGSFGGAYSRGRERADADARTYALLSQHGNGMAQPPSPTSTSGGSAQGASTNGTGAAGTTGGVSGGNPTNPSLRKPRQSTVDKAAECINNFRKNALAAMSKNCQKNKAKYEARAGTQASRAEKLEARNAAYQRLQDARNAKPPDQAAIDAARNDYRTAASTHSRAQHAACLADQARYIEENGAGAPPCRVPATGHDPGPPTTGPQETSGGLN